MSEPERKFTPKEGGADPYATRLVAELLHDRGILTCHYDPAAPFLFAGARDYLLPRWARVLGNNCRSKTHKRQKGFSLRRSPLRTSPRKFSM